MIVGEDSNYDHYYAYDKNNKSIDNNYNKDDKRDDAILPDNNSKNYHINDNNSNKSNTRDNNRTSHNYDHSLSLRLSLLLLTVTLIMILIRIQVVMAKIRMRIAFQTVMKITFFYDLIKVWIINTQRR